MIHHHLSPNFLRYLVIDRVKPMQLINPPINPSHRHGKDSHLKLGWEFSNSVARARGYQSKTALQNVENENLSGLLIDITEQTSSAQESVGYVNICRLKSTAVY